MEIHLDHRCKFRKQTCIQCGAEKPEHGPLPYCAKPEPCAVSFTLNQIESIVPGIKQQIIEAYLATGKCFGYAVEKGKVVIRS
jgi:hypothetical protein